MLFQASILADRYDPQRFFDETFESSGAVRPHGTSWSAASCSG